MKGGAFGFSKKEIIWFAIIFLTSLTVLIFCATRIVSRYYNHSEGVHTRIKGYSTDLWNLQEMTMAAVNTQRSSLNLLIYISTKNNTELVNVNKSVDNGRDSLQLELKQLDNYESLSREICKKIRDAGSEYLRLNKEFRLMAVDSAGAVRAADFNISTMRPALRKLTDLTRETGKEVTGNIHKITEDRVDVFSMYEFWILLVVALPYLYFLYRFLHLFIKILIFDSFA